MGLPGRRGGARGASAHHPAPRRADRRVSAAADRAPSAQEAPGLVCARLPARRKAPRGAVPGPGARGGPRRLLARLVTQRYFEDFTVGDRFKSPSRTLTDAHFLFFAGMTGDNHPIHYDDEYGKKTRYGGRLTHGLLLASLTAVGASTLAPLVEESIVAFVEQATRFRAPVFIGDTIYPEHEVVGLERKQSAGLLTLRVALRNQRGEVVLEGEHRYLIAYRPVA
ncbi:MAG: hypothetical protein DMD99_06760 [Candidatus Rokuibacteriota bacterium]|nr:MAG: hypothetical protein DMD99_06760 [Candidatus Rokubacteria bacterium]